MPNALDSDPFALEEHGPLPVCAMKQYRQGDFSLCRLFKCRKRKTLKSIIAFKYKHINMEKNHNTSLSFECFRPNTRENPSQEAQIRWSTTRTWTSPQPRTWSGAWSPTACTQWGWPATAARAPPPGPPGWSCAPKKEVSPQRMFVFILHVWVRGQLLWSESRLCYLASDRPPPPPPPCTTAGMVEPHLRVIWSVQRIHLWKYETNFCFHFQIHTVVGMYCYEEDTHFD